MNVGGKGPIESRGVPKSRVQPRTGLETSTPPLSKRDDSLKNANSGSHFEAPSARQDTASILKHRFFKVASYFIRRDIKGKPWFELAARLNRSSFRLTAGLIHLKMSGRKYFGKIAPPKTDLPLTLGARLVFKY